jgi:hypothetical protein
VRRRSILIASLFIIPLLVIIGSFIYVGNITIADVYFPTQKAGNLMHHELLGHGWLVYEDGSLRIKPFYLFSKGTLAIWPNGYTYDIKGREVRVINRDGKVVARTGHWMTYGGGPSSGEVSSYYLDEPIPDQYSGPYFIVSGVMD